MVKTLVPGIDIPRMLGGSPGSRPGLKSESWGTSYRRFVILMRSGGPMHFASAERMRCSLAEPKLFASWLSRFGPLLSFHLQQRPLPFHAPAITTHRAIFADHAMARNRHRHRIRSARARYRAAGPGLANRLRHLAVGSRRPKRNRLQISPHPPLKRRRPNVQWQRVIEL